MKIEVYLNESDLYDLVKFLEDPLLMSSPPIYLRGEATKEKSDLIKVQISYDQYIRIKDNQ